MQDFHKRAMKKTNKFALYSLSLTLFFLFFFIPLRDSFPSYADIQHLIVLHTNDTHGHPTKFLYYPMPDVGGLPARATLVNSIREEHKNVLLLDAGDLNTGKAESNLFKAKPDIEGYNYIGYDAMVLGNHEFDNPPHILQRQRKWANFPFLSANVKTKDGQYLTRPYLIKKFKGFTVAIFGLTTTATKIIACAQNTKEVIFEDEIEVAKKLVPKLKKEADIIIALVHMGIQESMQKGSKKLASEVSGIHLIVDGHTHTNLDQPIIISHPKTNHKTILVQAWKWGLVLGRVDLWIKEKKIIDFAFQSIPINLKRIEKNKKGKKVFSPIGKPIPEDETLLSMLQPYITKTEALLSEKIGYAEKFFSSKDIRERGIPLGDLVADSMLWYMKSKGADFALQNGGGIRTSLPKGPIIKKTVYEILPFDNTVIVITLTGSQVKSMFDHMAAAHGGAFPQVSEGVSFTLNKQKRKCENILIQGKPLEKAKTYKIATNSYLAGGGDGYKIFLQALDLYDTSAFQRDVLIKYIQHLGGKIKPKETHRIRIIDDQK